MRSSHGAKRRGRSDSGVPESPVFLPALGGQKNAPAYFPRVYPAGEFFEVPIGGLLYYNNGRMLVKRNFGMVPAVLAAVVVAVALRFFVFDIMRVEGRSMEPALMPGDILLVNRAAYGLRNPLQEGYILRWAGPRENEILVYRDPRDGNFRIKRCVAVSSLGVYVRGDNFLESVDSRLYGSIPVEWIAGKMLICF
ncbi:MAG: signal peptidase I [Spirochaetales bacterium]|jgi:signal peptidase I|nr:signal peptidase I [Spirochaetales bacterium]